MRFTSLNYVKDEDIGFKSVQMKKPMVRIASRGVVIRNDGKIALFYEENKGDYKLPGGGIEGGEIPVKTFEREVYEEVGCEVSDVEEIGVVIEERTLANFIQMSHVFVSKLKKDLHSLSLTSKERVWGGKMLWVSPKEALTLVSNCFDNLKNLTAENEYHVKFMVLRDRKILEYILGGDTFSGEMVMW